MNVKVINYRGRRGRIGAVAFDANTLAFFAGYNNCESCGVRGKVLLSTDDVRDLERRFGTKKHSLGAKVVKRLAKRYGI